jgi:hypothetical protein
MWIVIFVLVAIGFGAWFVRTPLFRAHLRSGKDPGDAGTRVEGKYPGNGGGYV